MKLIRIDRGGRRGDTRTPHAHGRAMNQETPQKVIEPLREVVRQLGEQSRTPGRFDAMIFQRLERIQELLLAQRPTGHPVDVTFPSWGKLGWSGRRGRWRLVVVDDEACEDLLAMPRECRAEACLVLPKLVERMGLG